jgi:L-asparaginase II
MDNPVLVEVTRGTMVESRHRGSVLVVDADGKQVFARGTIDHPVFPRSAVKAIQALPLFESGAVDRYGLSEAEIALTVASHSGEMAHAQTAASILSKAGQTAACLECGAHWPMGEAATRDLAATGGKPSALHNNCSGKHAGFICVACHLDADPADYVKPDHRVQREIKAAMIEMTGSALGDDVCGTDGCAIPTYAVPLTGLAKAFAQIGTGHGVGPERAKAFKRIRKAVAAHPFMVAGTGRFDADAMTLLGEKLFCKTGAEGVYCATLPEQGLGIAIKCDDGNARGAQVMMAAMIQKFLPLSDAEQQGLAPLLAPVLKNWNGTTVGTLRAVGL